MASPEKKKLKLSEDVKDKDRAKTFVNKKTANNMFLYIKMEKNKF